MAKIQLKYMICKDTNEWPRDEIYLKKDGAKVYSEGGVSVGETVNINKIFDMSGSSDVLRLFENDVFKDDFLGGHTVRASEAGLGERTASFTGGGANYSLVYEVLG
ncbi:hypothetical protein IFO70_34055 [Phormidium tenue FACHB-886]|nr:hypothetical protein [Phormidium tenue FACHB-886]